MKKLIENERRLQEAERLAKMGSWELDLINNELVWSDEIYRIFDSTPQSFGSTYEAFLSFVHPEDRELINDAYRRSVEEKTKYGPITHRLVMPDGNIKFVEERGETEYNEEGKPIRSYGIVQDITERVLGERTKSDLKEKEVLLKEIYHRVKNNLQLVSSLISIQENQAEDPEVKNLFVTCKNRIRTISLIHEQLYRSNNLANIKIKDHLCDLISNINETLKSDKDIHFDVTVDEGSIPMNEGIYLGLILNEIITNSFKHAFESKQGTITIIIKKSNDHWLMTVSDNGKGARDAREITESGSFGIDIVQSLVEQMDGQMTIETSPGNGVRYDFLFRSL